MSWSLSNLKKAEAEAAIRAAFAEQAANFDAAHRNVLDACEEATVQLADTAPEDGTVSFSTNGHINGDGSGSATVNVSLGAAVPAAAEPEATKE